MIGESELLPPKGETSLNQASDLAFCWEAAAATIDPHTRQAATFARASDAWAHDFAPGIGSRSHRHVHSQTRFDYAGALYTSAGVLTGLPGLTLPIEYTANNLVPYSEDMAAGVGWVRVNTPTVVAAAKRLGDITLDRITDASGASIAQVYQTVSGPLPSANTRAFSVHIAFDTNAAPSGSRIFFRDQTAGIDRFSVNLTRSASGHPLFTGITGTVLGYQQEEDGWRLYCRAATLGTLSNVHRVGVEPARVVGEQGGLYVGGWQVEDALSPSSYVRRVSGTTATRAAESLFWEFESRPPIRTGLQLYIQGVEMGTLDANLGLCDLGGNNSVPRLILFSAGGYQTQLDPGGGATGVVAPAQPTWGQGYEFLVDLFPDGRHRLHASIAGGAVQSSAIIAAPATWPPTPLAWGAPRITLNQYNPATAGLGRYRALKVGFGTYRSLVQMRSMV